MLKKLTAIVSAITLFVGSVSMPTMLSQAANYTGKLTIAGAEVENNTNSTAFYMKGTDSYQTGSDSWAELTMMPADNDTESGIFVDGVRINQYFNGNNASSVRLRKYNDTNNYYYIGNIPNVSTNSVVTVKGTFHVYGNWMETDQFDSTPIVFEESSFQWNGSQWIDYVAPDVPDETEAYTGKLTIAGSAASSDSSTWFYLEGTDEYKIGGDDWPELTMMPDANDTASGIFVDGVRINDYFSAGDNPNSVRLRKWSDSGNDYYIERIPNVSTNSVVTIKGTFYVFGAWMETDQFDSTPIIFEESSFKWDGSAWADYVAPDVPDEPEAYTGKLTIAGAEVENNTNATAFYLKGTDAYKIGGDNWPELTMMPADNDTESGIFVDGVRINQYFNGNSASSVRLRKYSDTNNYYYIGNIPNVSTNSVVTIKGTFYVFGAWMETDQFDSTPIIFEESSFKWDGSAWVDYVPVSNFSGTLSLEGAEAPGDANCMYLAGTDEMPAGGWELAIYAIDALSGIYLNDVKQQDAYVKKYDGATCRYYVGGFGSATEGDKLTIKGNFGYGNYVVAFEKITFEWVDGAWSIPTEYSTLEENVVLDVDYNSQAGGNEAGIYITTTDSMPAPGWEEIVSPMRGASNGVFYNGAQSNVYLKKIADGTYYVCLSDMGIYAQDEDEVTIKGKFIYGDYVVDFNSVTFYYNGQKWATTYTPPVVVEYVDITLKDLNAVSEFNTDQNRWKFYVNVEGKLPGDIDTTQFPKVNVTINDTPYEVVGAHSYQDTFYFEFGPDVLPQLPNENMKVTVKAGQYLTTDGTEGIDIKKDFDLYVNAYGVSTKDFLKPYVPAETNVAVSIDRDSAFGGNENGIYLNTGDHFKVDETWSELIRAIGYDEQSGVFYNGEKINATLKKFADGKIYVDLLAAGVSAQDKDKVVIKGTFYLDDYAVSYKEYTLHYNGKMWNETYIVAKEKYVDITGVSLNRVSEFLTDRNMWVVYINVEGKLPGEIDKLSFEGLDIYVDGKKLDTLTYHSYQDCLYFAIPEEYLSADAPNGKMITVKAGKALSANRIDGINWTKDFTFYTFLGQLTLDKPTSNTKWQDVKIEGLPNVAKFNKEAKVWEVFARPSLPLTTEDDTQFLKLPISIDGKTIEVTLIQAGDNVYFNFPEEVCAEDTKKATLTIKKGAKAIANAGRDGIRFTEDYTMYLYNGVWSDYKYDKTTTTEIKCVGMQHADHVNSDGNDYWNMYLWADKKIAGTSWYEQYDDFTAYYNGKEFQTRFCKASSSNGRLFFLIIQSKDVGIAKEGDIITVKPHTISCGAYEVKFTEGFAIQYRDGVWSEYVETDVKAPADDKMLWEVARFNSEYIPISENGTVNFSNSDKYNYISSMEDMKDYTISFTSKKLSDDKTTPSVAVVLRGQKIDEETEISTSTLYGYVVEFKANENKISDEESIWTGTINLWKNGRKTGLVDQYCIAYERDMEKPFFAFNEEYEYEFSIYNVTETCVCITVKVNGDVVMRHYDHATSDPMDPAVNAGKFAIYAEGMNGIYDGIYEVDEVLATSTECKTNQAVWVAGSYPYVMSKTDFTVDKEGAVVNNGVFKATKAGEYKVSCTYDGKEIAPVTISVTEEDVAVDENNAEAGTNWFLIGTGVATVLVVAVIGGSIVVTAKRRKKNA